MAITQETVDEIAEEKGLTVQESHLPSTEVIAGVGGQWDESDYAIPFVKLVQASSEEVKDGVCKPGVFLSTDGEQFDAIEFVPLHIQFVRDYYDGDAAKSICSSPDRITGYPKDLMTFERQGISLSEGDALPCAECPFALADQFAKHGCKKGYVVTCFDLIRNEPFMFRVRGSAMGVFKQRLVGAVAMGRSKPWARAFSMTSAKKTNGGNSWFAPSLEPIKGYSDEEQAEWAAYAAQFSGRAQEMTDDDA